MAGATDTEVIHGWLDIFGTWNGALAIMFAGSFIVATIAWRVANRIGSSWIGGPIPEKSNAPVDAKIIIGAVLFGVGWGIAGICPGPSIAGLTFSGTGGWIYFIFMCVGLKIGAPRKMHTNTSAKAYPKNGEVDHRCAQPVFGD